MSAIGDQGPVPILAARGVSKSFGEVPVLFSVDLEILPGEVHALMGENGAGKSTLVKILSGFEQPTAGQILLDGNAVNLPGNGHSERLGIALIHQELNLAEHLTVTESLFLGREITKFGFLDRPAMRKVARDALDELGTDIHVDALISDLSLADKQMVEIAKAISRNARVVFMDEPTAVLSEGETDRLFAQVRRLRAEGTSFVFVSHKLGEVMALSDRVTVLRDGQWIKTDLTRNLTADRIAQLMVGRELSDLYPVKHEPDVDAEEVLTVENLSTGFVKDASFTLQRGEILGFSGLIGSGRTELMEAIAGLRKYHSGSVTVNGTPLPSANMAATREAGVAYMTKDRKGRGLLVGERIRPNLTLQTLDLHERWGMISGTSEAKALKRANRRFDIRVRDPRVMVSQMSGGNQQKLLLAKIMELAPGILIVDEPTRGIDVGTKQQIYQFLSVLAREGHAVIVVSSEMPEIIGLSTRVAVMREGRIMGMLTGDGIQENNIMRLASGLRVAA
ncbi:sugar ABC transporter ATP-binding protein [Marivivens donghaensis]|uniref:Sugar ABC transporter ATP-binding protein n=1 Tax=Marivivens donghaensis TaxID=1699413 RepID=A0ABX0W198_9RHOB|nr:sugar ABC transporter ATP-binding protein [Marivivens donghaensis]NIY73879.1 sugar ABC transporter ATP-binding protein [Marivivens donghaensis]